MTEVSSGVKILHHRTAIRNVLYVCTRKNCEAESTLRFFVDEKRFPIIQCHNCKAGKGLELSEMLASNMGMVPVKDEIEPEYIPSLE